MPRMGGDGDWKYGRRVRDGMTFQLGCVQYAGFENDIIVGYQVSKHPDSVEFQVEYSVLTGPGATISSGNTVYTLSSWSRSCPAKHTWRHDSNMSLLLADDRKNISGCVIDMRLECDGRFPEDMRNLDGGTSTDV